MGIDGIEVLTGAENKHLTKYREEYRYGMRRPEYRVFCLNCTWEDKAQDEEGARRLGIRHEQDPNHKGR